jgi:hypothetical protein
MSFHKENIFSNLAQIMTYASSGVVAHGFGFVVEAITMTALSQHNWIRVPLAKVAHEVAESFVSASYTINLYEAGCNPLQAIKDFTKPIWNSPMETILAGVSSWGFEQAAVQIFGLAACNSCAHAHGIKHHHGNALFTTDNLIKGLASAFGSFAMTYLYHSVANTDPKSTDSSVEDLSGSSLVAEQSTNHAHDL